MLCNISTALRECRKILFKLCIHGIKNTEITKQLSDFHLAQPNYLSALFTYSFNIMKFIFVGGSSLPSKLYVNSSWLDRMGISEAQCKASTLKGNDSGCSRLPHVAPLWKEERNHDLVQVYKEYFERHINPTNLALFIDSYIRRSDLNLIRGDVESLASGGQGARRDSTSSRTLKMPVMNITGALSPHVDDTVTLNGRLDPTNSTWMKIQDCGMVLEEQPGKVSEAFRLFLQGLGYGK
ncbi:hypothetical protein J437_LFUL000442 [Ladona fulva]|uniref:Uncharacterized protein n=1 Tax=Ladona fulva TaxID=123851 RepID=A0A8K0NZR8_LADFU|nr:hypothetical protein J437_LFUL000442 [Ladona fulva]